MSWRAKAKVRLNFYPGTMQPTPPDYRLVLVSEPVATHAEACRVMESWEVAAESGGWEFETEEVQ